MGLFDDIGNLFGLDSGTSNSFISTGLDVLGLGSGSVQPVSYNQYGSFGFPQQDTSQMYPVMAQVPAISTGAIAASNAIRMIGFKIAQKVGLRGIPSLPRMMSMVRSLAKSLSPAATAVALGIGLDELATLMTASSRRKRRRMNPANASALRRSMRRLKSFDRLAHRVGMQISRGRGSRRRSVGRCNTCRKNPCGC